MIVDTKEEMPEGPPLEVTGAANGSQALTITWKVGTIRGEYELTHLPGEIIHQEIFDSSFISPW